VPVFPLYDEPTYIYDQGIISLLTNEMLRYFHRYKGNGYDITTSRGCPLDCTYCADNINKKLYGSKWKKIRIHSVDRVISQLKLAISTRPHIQFINFHDDSFSSRSVEWLGNFVERYTAEIKLPLMFRAIPGSINNNKMRILSKLDIIAIGIGLQSGSFRILSEVYNRPIRIPVFTTAVKELHAHKIIPIIDVMLNNPYEDKSDVLETIKVLSALPKPFLLELYGFRFYPGTELTERALCDGIISKSDTSATQATIEKNPEKDLLNKIVFITPHFPKRFILYLTKSEKSSILVVVSPILTLIGSFMNLLKFMYMIYKSNGYNFIRSLMFLKNTLDITTSMFHVFPFLRRSFTGQQKKQ
jgi:anaerobic magnesium-protoporphyrin IX monomethyl ester cyclase